MTHKSYLLLPFILYLTLSTLTLDQYPQYQKQTPQAIFDQIQHTDKINYPEISKLVFITPWNPNGKTLTIKYAHKLTYVSPCWYQLTVKNGKIQFQNDQLVDMQYVEQIKSANPDIKIIPRLYINNFQVFRDIGTKRDNMVQVSELVQDTYKKYNFDGIVWDSPYNLFMKDGQKAPLNTLIVEFVNRLKHNFELVMGQDFIFYFNLANPGRRTLDNSLYQRLFVDGLLIQNYDTPRHFHQMLRDSMKWLHQAKPHAKQIFMMLPFFSYKNYQGVSTVDVKKELEEDGIAQQGFERGMCKFISGKDKRTKYEVPCYKYFEESYKLLKGVKMNAGFWEGGNGLENYYLFM